MKTQYFLAVNSSIATDYQTGSDGDPDPDGLPPLPRPSRRPRRTLPSTPTLLPSATPGVSALLGTDTASARYAGSRNDLSHHHDRRRC